MTTEERIKRLEMNEDKMKEHCAENHGDIARDISDIKLALSRIEERVGSQKEQLGDGKGVFQKHDERIARLESIAAGWKGWFAGISVGTSLFTAFLIKVVFPRLHF